MFNSNLFPNYKKKEIYISQIKHNEIKAWRRHSFYEVIFFVVSGTVQLKCMNANKNVIFEQKLTLDSCNYVRVLPKIWYGFKGISESTASIMVILNGIHDESEIERMECKNFESQ